MSSLKGSKVRRAVKQQQLGEFERGVTGVGGDADMNLYSAELAEHITELFREHVMENEQGRHDLTMLLQQQKGESLSRNWCVMCAPFISRDSS